MRGGETLNSLYFGIGVTIILALLAALVGPLLVDWTAYRSAFEARATEILGHPVRVTGTADATLLPVPELAFTGVVIGSDEGEPLMTVGRFEVEVELFPLLTGEVRVTRMQIEDPELTLRVSADGALDWIAEGADVPIDPQKVVFDRIDVTGGTVRIVDERRPAPVEITGVNAAIEARSLLGPFKFDGGLVVEGHPLMMRLSTGTRDASGRVVVKATLTPATAPLEIVLDGAVTSVARAPAWNGALRVRRIVADGEEHLPWTFSADLDADPSRVRANTLEFRYGPEDRPFSIDGAATMDLSGAPVFDAVLSARQIDLDRTLGASPGEPVSFERALGAVAATLEALPRPPIPGRIGFDIPGIVVGGALVQSVRLDVETADDGWMVETLSAGLPGRTTLAATGMLATRPEAAFEGSASIASEQPATLLSWWYPDRERSTLDPFDVNARVVASAAGLRLSAALARLADARIAGEVAYVPERSGRRASIDVSAAADRIRLSEIVALGRLAAGEGEGGETDVVLRLSAGTVTGSDTAATGVEVAASLVGGTLTVDRFAIADLAGARVTAEGAVRDIGSAPDGSLQGRVSAERLDGLATLVGELLPGSAAAGMLRNAAPVLVPASLEATVTAARVGEGTNATVALEGAAGGSEVDASLAFAGRVDRWHAASVDLSLDMSGPSGVRLMRQLGFDVPDVPGAGVGRVAGKVHGVPQDGLELSLEGALGGTTVRLGGDVRLPPLAPATASLSTRLTSEDVSPILALGGDVMGGLLARTPVDLAANVRVDGPRAQFSGLSGTLDDVPVSGTLTVDGSGVVPQLRGEIELASAELEGLLELALGPATLAMPFDDSRNPWPEQPFGPTVLDMVDVDLDLSVDQVAGFSGVPDLSGLSTSLRSSTAGIGFDAVRAGVAGGTVEGSLLVKRDLEGQAAVSGTLALSGLDAATLAWRRGDLAVVTGALGAEVEFDATGRTVAGLVATLAGGGTLRLTDGVVRSMNPRAFSAVIRAADAGVALPDETIRDIFTDNVDVGNIAYERIEGAFTVAAGVLRAPSLVVTSRDAVTAGSATVDLGRRRLESDWTLSLADADAGSAATAPPQVDIVFRGPISTPERRVDVTAFSSFLGIRAFEKETERVLVLQADILERELLSRQVLRTREAAERRRRAEEEAARRAAEDEAARLAAEEAAAAGPAEGEDPDAFADEISRRLELLFPEEDGAEPVPQAGERGPLDLTPPPSEIRSAAPPPTAVQRLPLQPGGDASLPGVDILPPPL